MRIYKELRVSILKLPEGGAVLPGALTTVSQCPAHCRSSPNMCQMTDLVTYFFFFLIN